MFAPGARYTCYGTEYRVYNMAWGYNLTYTRLYSRGYSYTKIFLEPSPYIAEDIRSHQGLPRKTRNMSPYLVAAV